MGANITPTIKNNGRTVFGVKMGLSQLGKLSNALKPRCHILPCLQSLLPESGIFASISMVCQRATRSPGAAYSVAFCSSSSCALRGRGPGSISNRCARPAVMATWQLFPRDSANCGGDGEKADVVGCWKLRNAAAKPLPI